MGPNTITDADRETLLALNRDYIRSVQTSDVGRFAELLAPDFLCSNPDGSLVDRERFLKQTARPVAISNLEADDVNVVTCATCGRALGRPLCFCTRSARSSSTSCRSSARWDATSTSS